MDPGRRNMMENQRSKNKNTTAPRFDSNSRVSKPSRPEPRPKATHRMAHYLSEDEQSRRFVADEDKFVLKQSYKRADIRVREARAKPIDLLAFVLRYIDAERDTFDDVDGDLEIDLQRPDAVVEKLELRYIQELMVEIDNFITLETAMTNKQYWEALKVLAAYRKTQLDPLDDQDRILRVVMDDIDANLDPKNYEQLETLEAQIRNKMRTDDVIDPDYWEQVLRKIAVSKGQRTLARIFKAACDARDKLLMEQPSKSDQPKTQLAGSRSAAAASVAPGGTQPPGNEDSSQATKALYDREAARGISENEEIFTAEEAVPSSVKPAWADRYRARKPRYFNRVQMGYEWNKYNQTHYDHDNPPPKVVQGYKFNIFYPDLIDVTKTPTFKIIRENGRRRGESYAAAGEDDTCLIHFIGGPPYEDIAFRIVDREWDYSSKRERGFRSTFDQGILQLHFQFKKIFYRK